MESLKKLLCERGISTIFILVSFVCTLAFLFVYIGTGIDQFSKVLSSKVIMLSVISSVLMLIFTIIEIKEGKYLSFVLMLWCWLSYFITQVNYIANLIADIDGNSISVAFVSTVLLGAFSWAFALVSAILQKKNFFDEVFGRKANEEDTVNT